MIDLWREISANRFIIWILRRSLSGFGPNSPEDLRTVEISIFLLPLTWGLGTCSASEKVFHVEFHKLLGHFSNDKMFLNYWPKFSPALAE